MATPALRPAGKKKSSSTSTSTSTSTLTLTSTMAVYIQKLRDVFGWNLRNKKQTSACSREASRLQQELRRLQAGTAEHARTQKKLVDAQAELERLQIESADANRRYASELQQLKTDVDTVKADHEAEIRMLKANEARLIQDIQAGGDVNLSGAYDEITRLQGMLSETQRAYTQKNSELTRAVTDFSNQTLALKASYDAQVASVNRELTSCQSNFKKLNSDFTALNTAYAEQNSSILGSITGFDSRVRTLAQQFGDLERRFTTQESSTDGKLSKLFGTVSDVFEKRITEERVTTNSQIATEKTERTGYVDGKIDAVKNSLSSLFESKLADERVNTDTKVEKASFSLSRNFNSALENAQSAYDQKIKSALESARAGAKEDILAATQGTVDLFGQKLESTSSSLQSLFESKLADERNVTNMKVADVENQTEAKLSAERTERSGLFAGVDRKIDNLKTSLSDLFESRLVEERKETESVTDSKVEKASFSLTKSFGSALDNAQSAYDDKLKGALETARSAAKEDILAATQGTVDLFGQKLESTSSGLQSMFESKLADERSATNTQFESERTERSGLFAGVDRKFDNLKTSLSEAFESRLVEERKETDSVTDTKVEKASFSLTKSFGSALDNAQSVYDDKLKGALETARSVAKGDIAAAAEQTTSGLQSMFESKLADAQSLYDEKIKGSLETARAVAKGDIALATQDTVNLLGQKLDSTSSGLMNLFTSKLAEERTQTDSKLENERVERRSGLVDVTLNFNQTIQAARDASKGDFSNLKELFEDKIAIERAETNTQFEKESTERSSGFLSVASKLSNLQSAVDAVRDASKGDFTSLKEAFEDKLASERSKTDSQMSDEKTERTTGFLNVASKLTNLQDLFESKLSVTNEQIEGEKIERKSGFLGINSAIEALDLKFQTAVQAARDASKGDFTGLQEVIVGKIEDERNKTDAQIAEEQTERRTGFVNLASRFDDKISNVVESIQSTFDGQLASERATTDAKISSEQTERQRGLFGLASNLDSKFEVVTSALGSLEASFGTQLDETDNKIASEQTERKKGLSVLSEAVQAVKDASTGDFSSLKDLISSERAKTDEQIATEQKERATGFLNVSNVMSSLDSKFEASIEAARDASKGDFTSLKGLFETQLAVERATTDAQIASEKTERTSGLFGLKQEVESAVQAAKDVSKGDFSSLKSLFETQMATERAVTDAQIASEKTERTSGLFGLKQEVESAVQAAKDVSKGDFSSLKSLFETQMATERATTDAQVAAEGKNTDGKVEKASTGLKSFFSGALDDAQILYDVKIKNALEIARSVAKGDIAIATQETMDTIQSKLDTTSSKVSEAFDNQLGRITGLESFQTMASKALEDSQFELNKFRSNFQDQFAVVGTAIEDVKSKYTTIEAKFDSSFAEATTRLNSLDTSLTTLDASTNLKVTNLTNRLEETVNTATKTLTNQFGLSLDVLSNIVNVNTQTFKVALENKIDDATASIGSKLQGLGVDVDSMKTDFSGKFASAFSSIDGLTSGLQQANQGITSVVNDVKSVAGKFDDVSRALGDVTADFKTKFGSVDAVIDTLDKTLAGRIDTVHEDVKTTAGAVSNLESTFNRQVSSFQSDLQSVSKAAESATNSLAESTGKSITALEEDAKTVVGRAVDTAKTLLESRFNTLESATTALQNDAATVVDRAAVETSSRLNNRFSDLESTTILLKAKTATVVDEAVVKAKTQLEDRFSTLETSTNELKSKTATVVDEAVVKAKTQLEDRFSTLETSTNELKSKTATVVDEAVVKAKTQLETRFTSLETSTKLLENNGKAIVDDAVVKAKTAAESRFAALETSTKLLENNGKAIVDSAVTQAKTAAESRFAALESSTTLLANNGKVIVDSAVTQAKAAAESRFAALESSTTLLANNGKVIVDNAVSQAKAAAESRLKSLENATTLLADNGKAIVDDAVLKAKAAAENRFAALESSTLLLANNGKALVDSSVLAAEAAFKARMDSLTAIGSRINTSSDDLVLTAKSGRAVIAASSDNVVNGPALEVGLDMGDFEEDDVMDAWESSIQSNVIPEKTAMPGTTTANGSSYLHLRSPRDNRLPIHWVESWKLWVGMVHYKWSSRNNMSTTPAQTEVLTSPDGIRWTNRGILRTSGPLVVRNVIAIDFVEDIENGTIVGIGSTGLDFNSPVTFRGTYDPSGAGTLDFTISTFSFVLGDVAKSNGVKDATANSEVQTPAAVILTTNKSVLTAVAVDMYLTDLTYADGAFVAVGTAIMPAKFPTGYTPLTIEGTMIRSVDGGITWTSVRLPAAGLVGSDPQVVYGDVPEADAIDSDQAVGAIKTPSPALAAVPATQKNIYLNLTSIAYSPKLRRLVAYDSRGLQFFVSNNNGGTWRMYASTSQTQVNAVGKGLVYGSNVSVMWSSVLRKFILCNPDAAGTGSTYLQSSDGIKWTHLRPMFAPGVTGGFLPKPANSASHRPVAIDARSVGMFAISYTDTEGMHIVYTRNGTSWSEKMSPYPGTGGQTFDTGVNFAWSSDLNQSVTYALSNVTNGGQVFVRYSPPNAAKNPDQILSVNRRAPVRLGTTTDTGLALYSGTDRPQLVILPEEGGVEIQNRIVIGNTVITESQLARLLKLIEEPEAAPPTTSAPTVWNVTIEVDRDIIWYDSQNKGFPKPYGTINFYKDGDLVNYMNGLGLVYKGGRIVFKSTRSSNFFKGITQPHSFLRIRSDTTKKLLGGIVGKQYSGNFQMMSNDPGINQVYQDAKDTQKRTLKSMLNNTEALQQFLE